MSTNEIVVAPNTLGDLCLSAECWDGKRRTLAKVHRVSPLNPNGGVSYLERFITCAVFDEAVRLAGPDAPRWPCDYL